jgi:hypothetical protein
VLLDGNLLDAQRGRVVLMLAAFAGVAALFAIAMQRAIAPGGSAVIGIAIALLPIAAIVAWRAPLIFPYAAYVVLVPFDLLLTVPALGTAARLCGALSGAALAVWLVRRRALARPSAALVGWLAFVAWSAISIAWSIDPHDAPRETGTLAQVALLYAVVAIAPVTFADLRYVMAAVVGGGLAAAFFGIHELSHLSVAQQLISQASDRIPLLIGTQKLDINEFADSLLLPAAVAIVGAARAKNLAVKVGAIGVIGVLLYAMSLAESREAFVAVGLMLVYFMFAMRERWQLVAGAAVVAAASLLNGQLLRRFLAASATGGSGRPSMWRAGLEAFKHHWFAGAGSGSFSAAYNDVYLQVFQPYDMGWSRAAHNMLVENLVEYGIIGTGLLVLAIVLTFRSLPKLPQDHPLFGIRTALGGAMIGLCVAGFFVDLTTAKMFWLALSLVALVRNCAAMVSTAPVRVPAPRLPVTALFKPMTLVAVLAAAAALVPGRVFAAPQHVLTFLYYGQSFGKAAVNAKLSPAFMAAHADFIETSGFDNARVNDFKNAGGRFAATYIDPTFVPYCVPPFTEPAGFCAGQVGNLHPPAGAWFHDATGARVHRGDSYTGQYQEFLNPASPEARQAVVAWMNGFLRKSPSLDFFFADDSGSTLRGPDGTAASGMFYGFNAPGVEIAGDAAWIAGEDGLFSATPRRLILNGGDGFGPAYGGAFLRNPNVAGANHEGCFNSAYYRGPVGDDNGLWERQANGLLADLPFRKYSLCMMNGDPAPAARLYALASWWLTYEPQYSVAAPIAPAADGNAVFPEFDIVPTRPRETAGANVRDLARGGVFVREFAACFQRGVPLGGCAAIVNPSASARALPRLSGRYTRALVLADASSAAGGNVRWVARAGALSNAATIGPLQAEVLR